MEDIKIDTNSYMELVGETIRELDSIMEVSVKERLKDMAKSAMGRSVRSKDPMFWPAGMLMLGLVEARGLIVRECFDKAETFIVSTERTIGDIEAAILRHVKLWRDGYRSKIDYIDDALAGAALLKLYVQGKDAPASGGMENSGSGHCKSGQEICAGKYAMSSEILDMCRFAADRIYEYLLNAKRDLEGTIVYNPGRNAANVFADGVGQTSMFLALYGKVFGNRQALDIARTQLVNYMKFGSDERSGLIYHGYSLEKNHDGNLKVTKKGLLSWGRAAGWLMMGLSEYVTAASEHGEPGQGDSDDLLVNWYKELSATLLSYQRSDGCFSWQVQATDGPVDTSATGMILYGLGSFYEGKDRSKANGNEEYKDGISLALPGMLGNISAGRVGNALSSCDDFGVHYQSYGHYPWGQGAVLAALSKNMY